MDMIPPQKLVTHREQKSATSGLSNTMLSMLRYLATLACLLSALTFAPSQEKKPPLPHFNYYTARTHVIKPHRRIIPVQGGVGCGDVRLHLTLIISPTGDVTSAHATGDSHNVTLWPQVQGEVYQWKFIPFEKDGKPTAVEVDEDIYLAPPERLPTTHVTSPPIKPDSKIAITLERTSSLYGADSAYSITITSTGIVYESHAWTVADGKHTDKTDPDAVRRLAKRFVDSDFYSMSPRYAARTTITNWAPTYTLSIDIDGHSMKVEDYAGQWDGMPAVITDLEEAVDDFARTSRWTEGADGLVDLLKTEKYNFHTLEAQIVLKRAAAYGQTATVQQLLAAGVPLQPLPTPKQKDTSAPFFYDNASLLHAAALHPDTLQVLIDAKASKDDQNDKDLALAGAAAEGNIASVHSLLAYGANPNADLSKLIVPETIGGVSLVYPSSGSILTEAAKSGNPDLIREILHYQPKLELKNQKVDTALLIAATYQYSGYIPEEGARAECVRLLAKAGANVNAHWEDGNTALHKPRDKNVTAALIELGADVNARNNDGETPLFTADDIDSIPLLLRHGADPNLLNNKGKTALEATEKNQPKHEALLTAIRARASSQ
jgi:ankyrin repeat protein